MEAGFHVQSTGILSECRELRSCSRNCMICRTVIFITVFIALVIGLYSLKWVEFQWCYIGSQFREKCSISSNSIRDVQKHE
jgi:hypothetical protein